MDKKLTIIIIGANSGIGSKIIKYFNNKSQIYLCYRRKKPDFFRKFKSLKLDLNKIENIEKNLKKIKINNNKLLIINLASLKIDKLSINVSINEIRKTFNTNTFSFIKIIQFFLPYMMKNRWGRIINFSSTGGSIGEKGTLLYTSSKNASHDVMKVMSKEYANFNITFNSIKLGNFDIGLFKKLNEKQRKDILRKIPSNKTGEFKDIYNAIKFLVDSAYVNGSTVNIDGGYTL